MYLFAFFVVVPSITAVIGYAAWKGKPKNFSRELYWTVFVPAVVASGFVFLYAVKMHAGIGTWRYVLQLACFGFGILLFGIAGGCLVGIFGYRRGSFPKDPLQ
jgi:hypothetical protein